MTQRRLIPFLLMLWLITGCSALQQQTKPTKAQPNNTIVLATEREPIKETKTPDVVAVEVTDTVVSAAIKPPTIDKHDIWSRLRGNSRLEPSTHPRINGHLDWYTRHPAYLARVFNRAKPWLHWILTELEQQQVPAEIALLPIVESAYDPFAYSHGRAAGLWQFIPSTGRMYGLKQNWWYDGRRDAIASTRAAIRYLKELHKEFNGDWLLALAAYNSGSGTVNKALQRNKKKGRSMQFWDLDLPRETRHYVPKLLALSRIIKDPAQYNIKLPEIKNEAAIQVIDTQGQIDLALAARLADVKLEQLYKLNAGFNRWATDPNGPHHLVLPIAQAQHFHQQITALDPGDRIQWKRHKIKSGETLGHIAQRYHTTTRLLKDTNNISSSQIRAGKHLLIPVAQKNLDQYSLSLSQRHNRKIAQSSSRIKTTLIVQAGDSLWDLARKYKVSVRRLAAWNNMAPRDILRQGQKIIILDTQKTTVVRNNPFTITPKSTRLRTIRYTVRRGDSLARISQRFKVLTRDVCRWNKISRDKYLQPGQRLKIMIDITKQAEG
ncbi:MAG: LysM peptidoglycan-binding domain-containing protein [Gammaproteobacteria bacterium]|nr:LysM peptidoglycan-binding domain-containing protein [Gammaproteobacteria bacterium]